MTATLRYAGVLAVAYLVFLLLQVPPGWVLARAGAPEGLGLTGTSGTLWSGEAQQIQLGAFAVEDVRWQFRWWKALLGRLEVAFEAAGGALIGSAVAGRGLFGSDVYLHATQAEMPLQLFQQGLNLRVPLPLTGTAQLDIDTLAIEQGRPVRVIGSVQLRNAGLEVPPLPLGNYRIDFTTTDEGVQGALKDEGGPLQAQGLIALKPDGAYGFKGSFKARPGAPRALGQYLGLMGTPGPDGTIQITSSGQL